MTVPPALTICRVSKVNSLAEACLLAARSPGSHVYHVGSDRVKSLREVYAAVIEEAGTRSRLVALPAWPVNVSLALFHKLGLSPLSVPPSFCIDADME